VGSGYVLDAHVSNGMWVSRMCTASAAGVVHVLLRAALTRHRHGWGIRLGHDTQNSTYPARMERNARGL
jgi:hypothetical protein